MLEKLNSSQIMDGVGTCIRPTQSDITHKVLCVYICMPLQKYNLAKMKAEKF